MAWLVTLIVVLWLLAAQPAAQEVQQSPHYAVAQPGDSVSITCLSRGPLKGVALTKTWPKKTPVMYHKDGAPSTVDSSFWGRTSIAGTQHNLTFTLGLLQPNDTGIYTCRADVELDIWGPGTIILVTEADVCQEPGPPAVTLRASLALGSFLLGLGLGGLCVLKTQIGNSCASRNKTPSYVVYEDMSCSRHNTLSTPSHSSEP